MTSLIEQLLCEQQSLTAVEQFAQLHAEGALPDQQQYYSRLLPTVTPQKGQQYAFHVDLDKCSGCKACVTACHNLNGLDDNEAWRDVGLLMGGTAALPIMQHVTTACHHCVEPACASACPVDAYEKNPVTGIVKHLDDQCFGCQYCTMACPYDVPKYHEQKGIVRKCDMCSDRLAVGEAPACVQACPHEAIAIDVVNVNDVMAATESSRLLPMAPESDFTRPTTIFSGQRNDVGQIAVSDHKHLTVQHAHWPLIIMLVLSQLSVGMFVISAILRGSVESLLPVQSLAALVIGLLSIVAATCHLGRPQYAFRAIIGFRHSWLSREIVAFGAFATCASAYTLAQWVASVPQFLQMVLQWATIVSGMLGVFCSVMIYVFTRRRFWSLKRTLARFLSTSIILGIAGTWLVVATTKNTPTTASADRAGAVGVAQASDDVQVILAIALLAATAVTLAFEATQCRIQTDEGSEQLKRSAMLMQVKLCSSTAGRFAMGIVGGIVLPVTCLLSVADTPVELVALILAMTTTGEFLERYLFFAAVSPDRMPGGLRP